jgi:hypothetical protein
MKVANAAIANISKILAHIRHLETGFAAAAAVASTAACARNADWYWYEPERRRWQRAFQRDDLVAFGWRQNVNGVHNDIPPGLDFVVDGFWI